MKTTVYTLKPTEGIVTWDQSKSSHSTHSFIRDMENESQKRIRLEIEQRNTNFESQVMSKQHFQHPYALHDPKEDHLYIYRYLGAFNPENIAPQ